MAGQIIKRSENTYVVRIFMGRIDGKRKYHNKTIHGNKKDAERYLNKVLRERDTGVFIEPSKELLSDFLDTWLETIVKTRVRKKTFQNYKDLARLYIIPDLGGMMLSRISPEQIQGLYNKMLKDGLSPKTVRNAHGVLHNLLQQAVMWGKLYRNPAELVNLPRQNKTEMKALTPEETVKFIDAIADSRWKALFSLLITTGMRPGEALGLKWKDIDFEGKRVTVNRTLTRIGATWSLEEPKTARSRRTVPIPSSVAKDLEEHKRKQSEEKLRAEAGEYIDHGFVFAGLNGNPLDERNIVNRHFKPILEKAGLPTIRLYDLRHTSATLLLSAGENPKIVSERLGHASSTLTMDTYSHVLPDMQKTATEKLEAMLYSKKH